MTFDESIEELLNCTLELCKETLEWTGMYMGNDHANIEYKNYLINSPIIFTEYINGELDPYVQEIDLGNYEVPENIGVSDEMFRYIYRCESGYNWGDKLPEKLIHGKDVEGKGILTFGAGLMYHPNGQLLMNIKTNWSQAELDKLFVQTIAMGAKRVKKWASNNNIELTQNQIDSILSGCYNFGFGFLNKQICKLIIANPNNPDIRNTWAHLSDKQGVKFPGLIKRRIYEADHYFA